MGPPQSCQHTHIAAPKKLGNGFYHLWLWGLPQASPIFRPTFRLTGFPRCCRSWAPAPFHLLSLAHLLRRSQSPALLHEAGGLRRRGRRRARRLATRPAAPKLGIRGSVAQTSEGGVPEEDGESREYRAQSMYVLKISMTCCCWNHGLPWVTCILKIVTCWTIAGRSEGSELRLFAWLFCVR